MKTTPSKRISQSKSSKVEISSADLRKVQKSSVAIEVQERVGALVEEREGETEVDVQVTGVVEGQIM